MFVDVCCALCVSCLWSFVVSCSSLGVACCCASSCLFYRVYRVLRSICWLFAVRCLVEFEVLCVVVFVGGCWLLVAIYYVLLVVCDLLLGA